MKKLRFCGIGLSLMLAVSALSLPAAAFTFPDEITDTEGQTYTLIPDSAECIRLTNIGSSGELPAMIYDTVNSAGNKVREAVRWRGIEFQFTVQDDWSGASGEMYEEAEQKCKDALAPYYADSSVYFSTLAREQADTETTVRVEVATENDSPKTAEAAIRALGHVFAADHASWMPLFEHYYGNISPNYNVEPGSTEESEIKALCEKAGGTWSVYPENGETLADGTITLTAYSDDNQFALIRAIYDATGLQTSFRMNTMEMWLRMESPDLRRTLSLPCSAAAFPETLSAGLAGNAEALPLLPVSSECFNFACNGTDGDFPFAVYGNAADEAVSDSTIWHAVRDTGLALYCTVQGDAVSEQEIGALLSPVYAGGYRGIVTSDYDSDTDTTRVRIRIYDHIPLKSDNPRLSADVLYGGTDADAKAAEAFRALEQKYVLKAVSYGPGLEYGTGLMGGYATGGGWDCHYLLPTDGTALSGIQKLVADEFPDYSCTEEALGESTMLKLNRKQDSQAEYGLYTIAKRVYEQTGERMYFKVSFPDMMLMSPLDDPALERTLRLTGDINGNGGVDLDDAVNCLTAFNLTGLGLASDYSDEQRAAGDVNANGGIDLDDAISIIQYYNLNSVADCPTPWGEIL